MFVGGLKVHEKTISKARRRGQGMTRREQGESPKGVKGKSHENGKVQCESVFNAKKKDEKTWKVEWDEQKKKDERR